MKKISAKQYAVSLYEAAEGLSEKDLPEIISGFVKILIKSNNSKLTGKITEEFEKYFKEQKNIETVEVGTARELSESEKDKIISKLEAALDKKIELEESVDPRLIGGIRIKYKDRLVDGSIKARLRSLKDKIV